MVLSRRVNCYLARSFRYQVSRLLFTDMEVQVQQSLALWSPSHPPLQSKLPPRHPGHQPTNRMGPALDYHSRELREFYTEVPTLMLRLAGTWKFQSGAAPARPHIEMCLGVNVSTDCLGIAAKFSTHKTYGRALTAPLQICRWLICSECSMSEPATRAQ